MCKQKQTRYHESPNFYFVNAAFNACLYPVILRYSNDERKRKPFKSTSLPDTFGLCCLKSDTMTQLEMLVELKLLPYAGREFNKYLLANGRTTPFIAYIEKVQNDLLGSFLAEKGYLITIDKFKGEGAKFQVEVTEGDWAGKYDFPREWESFGECQRDAILYCWRAINEDYSK